jgi:hypothetical protein
MSADDDAARALRLLCMASRMQIELNSTYYNDAYAT